MSSYSIEDANGSVLRRFTTPTTIQGRRTALEMAQCAADTRGQHVYLLTAGCDKMLFAPRTPGGAK